MIFLKSLSKKIKQMKTLLSTLIISSFLFSCGTTKTTSTTYNSDGTKESTVSSKNIFGSKDLVKLKEEWQYETILADGEAPVVNKYPEESRNILLAKKGALLEAQRKLAEKIGTIRLNSTTTMQDFSTSDLVQSKINVFLKDVTIISENHNKELNTYKVTVEMPKVKLINVIEEYYGL